MFTLRSRLTLSAILLFSTGCTGHAGLDEGLAEPVGTEDAALDYAQPISLRVISIAGGRGTPMTDEATDRAVAILNRAGDDVGGLNFDLTRYDVYPITKDSKNDVPVWNDLKPIWLPMGITSVGAARVEEDMDWAANERLLSRWLGRYRQHLMSEQVVAWQGADGGVEMGFGAFFNGPGNLAHEMGHGFDLTHTFELLGSGPLAKHSACESWDLVYGMNGRGNPNSYFRTRAECDTFARTHSTSEFNVIDGRNSDEHNGRQRTMDEGIITVQHPRCSSCGRDLRFDQPAGNEVERYKTGDWQIAGYAKIHAGIPAVNALSYCDYWVKDGSHRTGCPDTTVVGGVFYSASQIKIMQGAIGGQDWIFQDRSRLAFNPPSKSCGYIKAGEGLRRDQPYYSCDGRFRLYLQGDSNLVLSQKSSSGQYTIPLWTSGALLDGTDTTDIALIMQGDGNLVVRDISHDAIWKTVTQGHPGAYVRISDSGDMKVRSADGSTFYWTTGTTAH